MRHAQYRRRHVYAHLVDGCRCESGRDGSCPVSHRVHAVGELVADRSDERVAAQPDASCSLEQAGELAQPELARGRTPHRPRCCLLCRLVCRLVCRLLRRCSLLQPYPMPHHTLGWGETHPSVVAAAAAVITAASELVTQHEVHAGSAVWRAARRAYRAACC
jgi:hypothetical protein